MESEIKSLFSEENIGNECLSDLMNFGRFCFLFGPTFKGEFFFFFFENFIALNTFIFK